MKTRRKLEESPIGKEKRRKPPPLAPPYLYTHPQQHATTRRLLYPTPTAKPFFALSCNLALFGIPQKAPAACRPYFNRHLPFSGLKPRLQNHDLLKHEKLMASTII
jgi:hypothetical protein